MAFANRPHPHPQPMEINMSNGDPLSVIFLDTEGSVIPIAVLVIPHSSPLGFAASNISESYDAKIFAVATLLSSYLLYNSVKV